MNSRNQSYIIYLMLFIAIIAMVYFNFNQQSSETNAVPINQLAADISAGKVSKVILNENQLSITYKNGDLKESSIDPTPG